MATNSKRDVRLGVEIETTGEDSIRRLADDVRKLAKEGTDAAPEFSRLAGELDKLADQSGTLAGLRAITKQVEELAAEQAQAAATVAAVGARYAETQTKVAGLRTEQARLAEQVRATKVEVAKAEGDLKTYAAGFDRAGKQTDAYLQRQALLTRVLSDAKTALAGNVGELQRIAPAVRAATAEEAKLGAQVEALGAKARESERALAARNRALDAARAAALAAGASTTELAEADARLLQSIQGVANETTRLTEAQRERAATAAAIADLDSQSLAAQERLLEQQRKAIALYDQEEAGLRATAAAAELAASAQRELAAAQAAAADAAAGAAEGVAAVKRLEEAAKAADAEFDRLTQSLRATETAVEQYAAATARAAGASRDDLEAMRDRRVAADALLRSEQSLDAAQRELAASRNASRAALIADAQALLAAARQADEYRLATERAVAASRRAGESIEEAFGAAGIRSINAIEKEIRETEVALERLNAAARKGALGAGELDRAAGAAAVKISRLQAEILQVQALPGTFERLSTSVNGLVTRFGALSAVLATVGFAALPVVRSFIALESATRILTSITGSATVAAEQIEFLRNTAQRSGQSFDELSKSYAKFAASALQTGLSLVNTQEVFDSVALAAGNLGLSSDQVGRALEALSQIASKGVVSMEELRGQLGDALPGVLPLLARELGLTTRELNKVVESGELLAGEAIPAIGRALRELGTEGGKPVQGLVAEFNRLKNAIFETTNDILGGALGRALGGVFAAASLSVRGLLALVGILSTQVTAVADKFGVLAAAVASLDFSRVAEEFARIDAGVAASNAKTISRLQEIGTAATGAAAGAGALGAEVEKVTVALGEATNASDAQVKSLAALAIRNREAIDAAEALARGSEKLVQAKKDEGEALVRTISLAGDEIETRRAAAAAAADLAAATDRLAASDRAVVTSLEAARASTLQYAAANGLSKDAIDAAVKAIDKSIKAKEDDAEKSRQQAASSRAAAAAAELAAAAAGDNADQYEALAEEVDNARTALGAVVRAFRLDRAGAEDVQKATERLVLAKGKLKDASNDQVTATNRVIAALKAEAEFTKAQIELEITRLRIQRDAAAERGNETTAARLGLAIKELELKATQASTSAKRDEANQIIRSTTLQLQYEQSVGTLTAAREQELQTVIRQQQAVIAQTDAAALNEAQQKKVNEEIRNGTRDLEGNTRAQSGNTSATGGNSSAVDRNTTSRRANAGAIRDQTEAFEELAAAQRASEGLSRLRQPGDPSNRLAADGGDDFSTLGPTGSGPTYSGQVPRPTAPGNWTFDAEAYAAAGYPANPDIAKSFWKRSDLPSGPGYGPFGGRRDPSPAAGGSVTMNVRIGGETFTVTAANRSAADEMVRALEEAYRAGGGT